MKRFRIVQGETYDGCIPITVYWVQVYASLPIIGCRWVNVKGYDRYDNAKKLLDVLEGK